MIEERSKEEAALAEGASPDPVPTNSSENTENEGRKYLLSMVYKALILYADQEILEILLGDSCKTTFWALDQSEQHGTGKEFIQKSQYARVVDSGNELMEHKITILHRALFIKDVVFAKDEGTVPQGLVCLIH